MIHGWEESLAIQGKTVHERATLIAASGEPKSILNMAATHVLALLERDPALFQEAWVPPSNQASLFARDGFDIRYRWRLV